MWLIKNSLPFYEALEYLDSNHLSTIEALLLGWHDEPITLERNHSNVNGVSRMLKLWEGSQRIAEGTYDLAWDPPFH